MTELQTLKEQTEKDYAAIEDAIESADEDMRFISEDGGMWQGYLEDTVDDSRVKLELDVTSPHVMRYIGERNKNRANAVFTPDDINTNEDDAELLNGVYRSDFKDNDGQISQDLSIYETAVCGMGAFKLSTRFVDDEDPENEDQEIIWTPITNAYSHVLFDETATRADKADAKRVTLLTAHSKDAFEEQWPDFTPASAFTVNTNRFSWSTREVITVAERYEIKVKKVDIQVWRNVEQNLVKGYNDDEIKDEEAGLKIELESSGWEFVRSRKIKRRTVWKTIFSGQAILEEEKQIPGKWLPVIPMYGIRTYLDNKENYRGLVRKLKDANRVLNTGVSRMTEDASTSGGSLPILTRSQQKSQDVRDSWANKNGGAYVLIDDQLDSQGNPVPNQGVPMLQPNAIDPNTLGVIDVVSNFVQRETGNAPQDQIDPDASGVAIDSLRERENLTTQPVTDNIHQSIKHSAKVYESMAGDTYTRTQMKKVLDITGKQRIEQLNIPSLDPETGNAITLNDLSKGRFSVDIELGPQYESQKAATIGSLERVIEKVGENSPLQPALIGAWVDNIEGTGLDGVKELNRKIMLQNGTAKPESPEEEQMVQAAQSQEDPQAELNKAITNQQNAEAENLRASSAGKVATAQKDMATAEKTKAETAEIVVDINTKLQESRADQIFNRFAERTQIGGGQA
jgi:hypothetical protein